MVEVPVGLVIVGLLVWVLVGESGCLALMAMLLGMQAVGMAHSEGMGAAPKTGTVAVDAKEITGVGRATLNWGSSSGERVGGGEERALANGMNGPVAGWMVMPVWAGMAGGDMRGGPSWALAATAALMASSRWARKFSRWLSTRTRCGSFMSIPSTLVIYRATSPTHSRNPITR